MGLHGLYEANMAMHDSDLIINIGARFDDRVTGRLDACSPVSKKAHIDIDASSINKVIHVDMPILGDVAHVLEDLLNVWKSKGRQTNKEALNKRWSQIGDGRAVRGQAFKPEGKVIKPPDGLDGREAMTRK